MKEVFLKVLFSGIIAAIVIYEAAMMMMEAALKAN
jgi:hypothetical protein